MHLPQELVEKIICYLRFEKLLKLNKRLALVKYNSNKKLYMNICKDIYFDAIINDELEVVKWMYTNNLSNLNIRLSLAAAASKGSFEVVKFLYTQHDIVCDYIIDARSKRVSSPKPPSSIYNLLAIDPNDLLLIPTCTLNTFLNARKNNHKNIVDWLEANEQISCCNKQYDDEIVKKVLLNRIS
jgi:hypothetical protein